MIKVKIGEHIITLLERIDLNLKFDSVCSTFSFTTIFNANNPAHKKMFAPGGFQEVIITYNDKRLLTGMITGVEFGSAGDPPKQLVTVGGYSKTGVLEDCPPVKAQRQNDGLTMKEIAEAICKDYYIDVIVDEEVEDLCDTVFTRSEPKKDESVRAYLDRLASHLNVVLSHNAYGDLLLTTAKAGKLLTTSETIITNAISDFGGEMGVPNIAANRIETASTAREVLYHFDNKNTPTTAMRMSFNGQRIHSDVQIWTQWEGTNDSDPPILFNPYFRGADFHEAFTNVLKKYGETSSRGRRPRNEVQGEQTDQSDNKAPVTARAVLGDELKAVTLNITTDRWVLDGAVITPNQIITAENPDVYLYHKTKWFIQEVKLRADAKSQVAEITCVPPDAFSNDDIVNLFTTEQ